MPSHRLFVSSFAIISVLSVALPVVADELTPQQIYERAAPAVVLVIGHSEEGGNGSGGEGLLVKRGGRFQRRAHDVFQGKKQKADPPHPACFQSGPAKGKPPIQLVPKKQAGVGRLVT